MTLRLIDNSRSPALRTLLLGAVFLAVLLHGSVLLAQKQGSARVTAIRGSASYSDNGEVWKPLKVYTILHSGSWIKTAKDCQVDLFLKRNGPVVRLTEETQLGLDTLLFDDTNEDACVIDTRLNLRSGRIFCHVAKLAAGSKYAIAFPNHVVEVSGNDFEIAASGVVKSLAGKVTIDFKSAPFLMEPVVIMPGESRQLPLKRASLPTPLARADLQEVQIDPLWRNAQ